MKKWMSLLMALVMLLAAVPVVDAQDLSAQAGNAWEEIVSDFTPPVYHTVTFTSDGRTVATYFAQDGTALGKVPDAPRFSTDQQFLGWYDGNAPFDPEAPVTADTEVRAVCAQLDTQLEVLKKLGNFMYTDTGAYGIVTVFGSHKKNQKPSVTRNLALSGDMNVLDGWTVSNIKNNTTLYAEVIVTRLPEDGTLSVRKVKDGALSDIVAQNVSVGDRFSIELSMKGANGIALATEGAGDIVLTEGALYANEHLYITGKIPGNGIIEAVPVTVSVAGEELIAAYDIKIYANENQRKKGKTWKPAGKKVQVHFYDDALTGPEYNVWHLEDASSPAEFIDSVQPEDGWVTFGAESFSVYAVTRTTLEETITTSDGATYAIEVTYDNTAGIPMEGTALYAAEILPDEPRYAAYLSAAAGQLGVDEGKLELARPFDIRIVSEEDPSIEYEPAGPVEVSIRLIGTELSGFGSVDVLHFASEPGATRARASVDVMDASVSGESVVFTTGGFSVYVVAGYTLETVIEAGDGNTYRITVTFLEDAQLPEDAALKVEEIAGEALEDYLGRTAVALDAAGFAYGRVFDITIVNGADEEIQPAAQVGVSVELLDAKGEGEPFSVVHFEGEEEEPQVLAAETEGNTVTFSTDGFSAYAIVQGPEAIPFDWQKITTLEDLLALGSQGVYIGHKSGYYFRDSNKTDNGRTGILKTGRPASPNFPPAQASKYYIEQVPGTDNQIYAYTCPGNGSTRYYIYNGGDNNLSLVDDESMKTAFTVTQESDGTFQFNNGAWYWNQQGNEGGTRFCSWNVAKDKNNYMIVWHKLDSNPDPYQLSGKSFGLMSWADGASGKAMMAEENAASLVSKPLTVMTHREDNTDKLFVPNDSDITMWTFEWAEADRYTMKATVDGADKYLSIGTDGISLADTVDDACKIQIVPGTGIHAGQIALKVGDKTITYSGDINTGFGTKGMVGNEWLYLVELSELTSDYFRVFTATKVGVSDATVRNGSRVIVYSRVWNPKANAYQFYAIDHDGTLVRCYESGDDIEWVGSQLNTMLWNFVEYYEEGSTTPNYYYELYNEFGDHYIGPEVTSDRILSDEPVGINMNGRRNGEYYSNIVAWDDPSYSYSCLKADLAEGRVLPIPFSIAGNTPDAVSFAFAIVQDLPIDDALHTVPTVDHEQYGIKMKIIDLENYGTGNHDGYMSEYLGSANYVQTKPTQGLLSTNLGADGYPTVPNKGGVSLAGMYASAAQVNHLFIESTYRGSGYYVYDSTQNFATLQGSNFCVYQELATYDGTSKPTLKHGQFFPFNDIKPGVFASVNGENLYSATAQPLSDADPRKHERLYLIRDVNTYFAVELEASFVQTPNGLDNWGHDIIYEFTGDDDFWLYVDGELIIDLGGIHGALPGSVNYSTGDVYVNGVHYTLPQLFEQNYRKRNPTATDAQVAEWLAEYFEPGSKIFKDNTTHTMRIFYMERGAGASNLKMRFNLSSVKPGSVLLSKELKGVDNTETILSEFPYQISFTLNGRNYELVQGSQVEIQGEPVSATVYYKDTTRPVKFAESYTVDGVTYRNVFLLKPGETAEIDFGFNAEYQITECGVNTDVFDKVTVNDAKISGIVPEGATYPDNRMDFRTTPATTENRARVAYANHVKPDALRSLTFSKRLFHEDGVTPITYEEDPTLFSFRLYLGTESESGSLPAANIHIYHVKTPEGEYCRWNYATQSFVSLGKTNYEDLTLIERIRASFQTSINGSISRIPVNYQVEVRNLLAGTRFAVLERPWEIPDGYSFQKYLYSDDYPAQAPAEVVDPPLDSDGVPYVEDQITAGKDPHVDVCNVCGYGLRVNKVWTDEEFMQDRAPTYFALFTNNGGTLTLVPNSVRRLPYGADSLYWYYLTLPVAGVSFEQYVIREVTLSNPNPTVDENGYVTNYGAVTPVLQDGEIHLTGRQKGETADSTFTYTVLYEEEQVNEEARVKVTDVTNRRPGIILKKEDWESHPLPGATFTLTDDAGSLIGTFTSDETGLITTAFLREDTDYTLTETVAPRFSPSQSIEYSWDDPAPNYSGLKEAMTIRVIAGRVTVTYPDNAYYTLEQGTEGEDSVLTIKNRPYVFRAVKIDGDRKTPLKGAVFALHRQVTVDGVTAFTVDPMPGYESLVTDENGYIPLIDGTLRAGVFQLRELTPPGNYLPLESYVYFTYSAAGNVVLNDHPEGTELTKEILDDDTLRETLIIRNWANADVTLTKTVTGAMGDRTKLFSFTMAIEDAAEGDTVVCRIGDDETELTADAEGKVSFSLRHGQSAVLTVPYGKQLVFVEDDGVSGSYTKTWTGPDGSQVSKTTYLNDTLTVPGITEATQIGIENHLEPVSPTGYRAHITPYLLMLLAGAALLVLSRRRKKGVREDA